VEYRYYIMWSHGLEYEDEILEIIRARFKIIYLVYHEPRSWRKLIKKVYSHSYVPARHLKNKLAYLKKLPKEMLFVFVENTDEEEFQTIKEGIRDWYNPKKNEHVIHGSDNEKQTDVILKYLGYSGIDYFKSKSPILDLPFYLKEPDRFEVKKVDIWDLSVNVAGEGLRHICSIPHVYGKADIPTTYYEDYIKENRGKKLRMDYTLERFKRLSGYEPFICVKNGIVQDGAHRLATLWLKDEEKVWVVQI